MASNQGLDHFRRGRVLASVAGTTTTADLVSFRRGQLLPVVVVPPAIVEPPGPVEFIGSTTTDISTGDTLSLVVPEGTVNGDLVVVQVYGSAAGPCTWTIPYDALTWQLFSDAEWSVMAWAVFAVDLGETIEVTLSEPFADVALGVIATYRAPTGATFYVDTSYGFSADSGPAADLGYLTTTDDGDLLVQTTLAFGETTITPDVLFELPSESTITNVNSAAIAHTLDAGPAGDTTGMFVSFDPDAASVLWMLAIRVDRPGGPGEGAVLESAIALTFILTPPRLNLSHALASSIALSLTLGAGAPTPLGASLTLTTTFAATRLTLTHPLASTLTASFTLGATRLEMTHPLSAAIGLVTTLGAALTGGTAGAALATTIPLTVTLTATGLVMAQPLISTFVTSFTLSSPILGQTHALGASIVAAFGFGAAAFTPLSTAIQVTTTLAANLTRGGPALAADVSLAFVLVASRVSVGHPLIATSSFRFSLDAPVLFVPVWDIPDGTGTLLWIPVVSCLGDGVLVSVPVTGDLVLEVH